MGILITNNDERRFLFVEFTGNETRLSCVSGEQLRGRTQSPSTSYRVSPIFPVVLGESRVPGVTADYCVGFFFFEDPSFAIGKIIAKVPKQVQRGLWFSHGLASVICFAEDRADFEAVRAAAPEKLRAVEIWKIIHGRIEADKPEVKAAARIHREICTIKSPTELDAETQVIVNELRHCLNTAVARAAQFLPSSLKTFERLFAAVNDIISELTRLERREGTGSKLVCVSSMGAYEDPPLALQKRKQQLTDQLIQINSALSYVISQAYSGISPILEHECQIRNYSLLAVH